MDTGNPDKALRWLTRIKSGHQWRKEGKSDTKRGARKGASNKKRKIKDWENPESPLEAVHALTSPSIHMNNKSIEHKTGTCADYISWYNYR